MAEGRSRQAWAHTSNILAMLYNANRGSSQAARGPAAFNPYLHERPAMRMTVEELCGMIVG